MAKIEMFLNVEGTEDEALIQKMRDEFIRVYNIYTEILNDGLIKSLNNKWDKIHGDINLLENPKLYAEYNKYIAENFQTVVDRLGKVNPGGILEFKVDPKDDALNGYLKKDPDVRIWFELGNIVETEEN